MNSAPDRSTAKGAILARDQADPEMARTLDEAKHQLEAAKESNAHTRAMYLAELGFFGRMIGGEKTAPVLIAGFAVAAGLLVVLFSAYMAGQHPDREEFWGRLLERGFAFSAAALAFVFGRSGRTPS